MAYTLPYTKLDLLVALKTAEPLIDKLTEKGDLLEPLPGDTDDPKEQKKAIAEHHGITLMELINSPNYEKLVDEFAEWGTKQYIKRLEGMGFDHKQSCAILAVGSNLLD